MNIAGIAFVMFCLLFPGLVSLAERIICHFVMSEVSAKAYTVTIHKSR